MLYHYTKKTIIVLIAIISININTVFSQSVTLYNRTESTLTINGTEVKQAKSIQIHSNTPTTINYPYYKTSLAQPLTFIIPANTFTRSKAYTLYTHLMRGTRNTLDISLFNHISPLVKPYFPFLLQDPFFYSQDENSYLSLFYISNQRSSEQGFSHFVQLKATNNYRSCSLSNALVISKTHNRFIGTSVYKKQGTNKTSSKIVEITRHDSSLEYDPLDFYLINIIQKLIKSGKAIPHNLYKDDQYHNLPLEPILLNLSHATSVSCQYFDIYGKEISRKEDAYGAYIQWNIDGYLYKNESEDETNDVDTITPAASSDSLTTLESTITTDTTVETKDKLESTFIGKKGTFEVGISLGHVGSHKRTALFINHAVFRPSKPSAESNSEYSITLTPKQLETLDERKNITMTKTNTPIKLKERSQKHTATPEILKSNGLGSEKTSAGLTPAIDSHKQEKLNDFMHDFHSFFSPTKVSPLKTSESSTPLLIKDTTENPLEEDDLTQSKSSIFLLTKDALTEDALLEDSLTKPESRIFLLTNHE